MSIAAVACGGTEGQLEPRFVAVHNAMSAMGLAQTGQISEGSLPEGAEARITQELVAGECYTFIALGSSAVSDINLRILDEDDEEVGADTTHDRQAAAQVCAERSGEHHVVVRMERGQGGYTVSSWSGAIRGGSGHVAVAGAGAAGTCARPLPLELGRPVSGSTTAPGQMDGTCVSGGAGERVYLLELTERAQVQAVIQSGYDGALYLQRNCGDPGSEIICNDDSPNTQRSQIDATLEPGEYFLVVDGYGDESGEFELIVSASGLQSVAAICSDAAPLPIGQPVTGSTVGAPDYFQATCAGGARSPDRVYRLDVSSRSRLRLRQESDHDGSLYIRSSCDDPTSELACNDDFRDNRHAMLTTVLDPGQYFVYADGFSTGQAGNFTLAAETTSASGGGASSDACNAASTATPGQAVSIDTFQAADDYAGSCGGQGGPDVVYEVSVRSRSRFRATINEPEFAGTMYLQSTCGDTSTEVACTQTAQGGQSVLDTVVAPGTYYLVIDGQRPETFGSASVEIALDDLRQLERACRRAPIARPGRVINGNTNGGTDQFQASCAGGAGSNDVVYRIVLRSRQTVRVNMSSDYDGALHLRRDCIDPTTELACNDDHTDEQHSMVETTLDPGTYYLIVDGFRNNSQGNYTVEVQTSNP